MVDKTEEKGSMVRRRLSGWKILLLIELFVILVLLWGCFKEEECVSSFSGESMAEQVTDDGGGQRWLSASMELTPGVYQLRVWEDAAAGQSCYINMACDSEFFKSLCGNGVMLCQGQGYIDFEFYILNKISSAYISCDFYGGNPNMLTELELYRLNWGNRMVLFMAVLLFSMLDGLLVWRRRILEGKVDGVQQLVFWRLVGTVLLAYFPYLTDYFIIGDDTLVWLQRIEGMRGNLLHGEVFLWLPVLLRFIGFPVMTAYKLFVLATIAATAVISYLSFKRCVQDRQAALFGAFAYTLNPWYLYTVYCRGAVGEFSAMTFLPLVFCGIYSLFSENARASGDKQHKWYIAVGIAAILQGRLTCDGLNVPEDFVTAAVVLSAMLLSFIYKRFSKAENKQLFIALILAAVVMIAGGAMYQVNDIAFRSQAVRIYTAEDMGSIPEVHKGSPVLYLAQGVFAVSILVLSFKWVVKRMKAQAGKAGV